LITGAKLPAAVITRRQAFTTIWRGLQRSHQQTRVWGVDIRSLIPVNAFDMNAGK
jgi:hypothetical protein